MNDQPDDHGFDDPADICATPEQLEALARLGVADADLQNLTWADAEDWIERLRAGRRGAGGRGRASSKR